MQVFRDPLTEQVQFNIVIFFNLATPNFPYITACDPFAVKGLLY